MQDKNLRDRLSALVDEVCREAEKNPDFLSALEKALTPPKAKPKSKPTAESLPDVIGILNEQGEAYLRIELGKAPPETLATLLHRLAQYPKSKAARMPREEAIAMLLNVADSQLNKGREFKDIDFE